MAALLQATTSESQRERCNFGSPPHHLQTAEKLPNSLAGLRFGAAQPQEDFETTRTSDGDASILPRFFCSSHRQEYIAKKETCSPHNSKRRSRVAAEWLSRSEQFLLFLFLDVAHQPLLAPDSLGTLWIHADGNLARNFVYLSLLHPA